MKTSTCRAMIGCQRHIMTAMIPVLMIMSGLFGLSSPLETIEVCMGEEFEIECGMDEVIMMTSAEYGRKDVGRCIPEQEQDMGCTNDVLPLLDRWCSGRRECGFIVPNADLDNANSQCRKNLYKYLSARFTCVKFESTCNSHGQTRLAAIEGTLSSHVTDETGCGSARSPWVISVNQGQRILMKLIDFGSSSQDTNYVSCKHVYGYILERALGINHTICGGRQREGLAYTSKTNSVEVHMKEMNERRFLIRYSVIGCIELVPPAHAWYKREGNEAVIGCESNDQEWKLTCTGNTWEGSIGNCTVEAIVSVPKKEESLGVSSFVIMTAVVGGSIVAVVITIMIGVVYIGKYRMRQETKHMEKTYSTMEKNPQSYYPPSLDPTLINPNVNNDTLLSRQTHLIQSWGNIPSNPGDPMAPLPVQCTCATLPTHGHRNENRDSCASLMGGPLYDTPKFDQRQSVLVKDTL